MRAPSSRTRKIAGFAAGPLAIVAAGAMVWQGSSAAFTANTNSESNNWSTGVIGLSDNDSQGATFAVTGLVPGASGSRCITVTATSSLNTDVPIRASVTALQNGSDSTVDFSDRLMLKLEAGTFTTPGATAGKTDCSDFSKQRDVMPRNALSTLASTAVSAPADAGTAVRGSSTVIVYKVSYDFDTTTLNQTQQNALMGQSTGATLVWEMKAGA